MISISHKHRFIYIEITKCATTTLQNHFKKMAASYRKEPDIMRIPKWLKKSGLASDLDLYPNHFVFTFVRNPFDRFLSFFLQGSRALRVVKEDGFLDQDIFNGRQGDIDTQSLHILPSPYGSLEECAEQTQQGLWKLKENLFIHGNKYTYVQLKFERWHSKSQARFLLELSVSVNRPTSYFDGNPCSFIGRVENFEQDFFSLVSLLGCRTLPVEKRNVSHEREAAGEKRHYSTYYTKRARTLVEEIYAKDLDLLGYEFEDETKTSAGGKAGSERGAWHAARVHHHHGDRWYRYGA